MTEKKYNSISKKFLRGMTVLICLGGIDIIIATFVKQARNIAGVAWMGFLIIFLLYMILGLIILAILKRKVIKEPTEQKQHV